MIDELLADRFKRQIAVKFEERKRPLLGGIRDIDAQAAARGMFQSSTRVLQLQKLFFDELEKRAALAWQSLVRAHQAIGTPVDTALREGLKALISEVISNISAELAPMLEEQVARSGLQNNSFIPKIEEAALPNVFAKYEVEADLYVDSLRPYAANAAQTVTPPQHYYFYGPVGSFQTGANSTANVTQTLGGDKDVLLKALSLAYEAIKTAESIGEQKRKELLAVTEECVQQVQTAEPNNTKLFALFNVLTMAIQTIPNAVPAYNALQAAVTLIGGSS
jgi:hypothetical protein